MSEINVNLTTVDNLGVTWILGEYNTGNTVGGPSGSIQYNAAGAPLGTANLTYAAGTTTATNLTVTGTFTASDATTVKIGGGSSGQTLVTDGNGNLQWAGGYANITPHIRWDVTSNGTGQSFTFPAIANYSSNLTMNVTRNGVLVNPNNYSIVGPVITFTNLLRTGDYMDILATSPVLTTGGGGGGGTVTAVVGNGSGLGFSLSGTVTTTGNLTLATPTPTNLRADLGIGNIANGNLDGNTNNVLRGDGTWGAANYASWAGNTPGHWIPNANITYDLGNNTQRWRDIYLANSTIYLGETGTISSDANGVILGDISVGNITGNTATLQNVIVNGNTDLGNIANITVSGGSSGDYLQTDGNGALSWGAPSFISNGISNVGVPTSGGDVEVFTGGSLTTIFSAADSNVYSNLGVSQNLIVGGDANITGNLGVNATVTANSYIGEGGNLSNIALANVTGAGNIASINLDGNVSNVLNGNGAWIDRLGSPGNTREMLFNNGGVISSANTLQYDVDGFINVSRSNPANTSSVFRGINYSNSRQAFIGGYRARGTKSAPTPLANNDTIFTISGLPYTGSGTLSTDGITGWTSVVPSIGFNLTQIGANGVFANTSINLSPTKDNGTFVPMFNGYGGNNSLVLNSSIQNNTSFTTDINGLAGNNNIDTIRIGQGGGSNNTHSINIGTTSNSSTSTTTINGNTVLKTTAPATSTSNGTIGQIAFDADYIYYCYSTNLWKRSPLTTW